MPTRFLRCLHECRQWRSEATGVSNRRRLPRDARSFRAGRLATAKPVNGPGHHHVELAPAGILEHVLSCSRTAGTCRRGSASDTLSLQELITARTEIQHINKFALEEVVSVPARIDRSRSSSPTWAHRVSKIRGVPRRLKCADVQSAHEDPIRGRSEGGIFRPVTSVVSARQP